MRKVSLFLGIAAVVLLFSASCRNNNSKGGEEPLSADIVNNPNTADGNVDTTMLARFQFAEEVHDFGRVIQGEKVSYSFKFKNTGKSDLVISDARGSCGCTVADYPKSAVRPNEEGAIDVTFNTEGKKGFQSKTITLVANTQPNTKVLTIKAQIKAPEEN